MVEFDGLEAAEFLWSRERLDAQFEALVSKAVVADKSDRGWASLDGKPSLETFTKLGVHLPSSSLPSPLRLFRKSEEEDEDEEE